MAERLYTTRQVADLLGATPGTVDDWVRRGWLTSELLPQGNLRVSESGLVRFLKDRGVDLEAVFAATIVRDAQKQAPPQPKAAEPPPTPAPPAARPSDAAAAPPPPASDPPAPRTAPHAETPPAAQAAEPRRAAPAEDAPLPETEAAAKSVPATAARVLDAILQDAVTRQASAVHLDTGRDGLSLRLRVNGQLREKPNFRPRLPQALGPALVARFKTMAGLDPAESRRAQDGSFPARINGHEYQVRVSVCPTVNGESLVVHFRDLHAARPTLEGLGLSEQDLETVRQMLAEPSGLVLVTAPPRGTGATLAAMAAAVVESGRRLVAVEMTAEIEIPAAIRTRPFPEAGYTSAAAVRAIMAQDAEAILIEDIRDRATAQAAVDAALAGHLVLGGLATRSTSVDPLALLAPEVDAFALARTLLGVTVQRTVRKVCAACRATTHPSHDLLDRLGLRPEDNGFLTYTGRGCSRCGQTGLEGETNLFSVLRVDSRIARLIREGAGSHAIEEAGRQVGMATLRDAAIETVHAGEVSLEEAVRTLGL